MYNINFQVKYHDIETALLMNLQKKMELRLMNENLAYIEETKKEKKDKQQATIVPPVITSTPVIDFTPVITSTPVIDFTPVITSTPVIDATTKPTKGGKKPKAVKPPKEPKSTKKTKTVTINAPNPTTSIIEPITKDNLTKDKLTKNNVTEVSNSVSTDTASTDSDDEEEYDYNLDDVYAICEKLYRDELLSVFNFQSISDENIDAGIKSAIEQMIDNQGFRQLLDDIKFTLIDYENFVGTPTEMENIKRNSEYLIFITLFSQKLFYLTHICLCQLFTVGEIEPELLQKIKEKTISLFTQ